MQGLIIALLNIDEVIALIRASKSPKAAKQGLMERFDLTAVQADAILDLRLQRLTNLEQLEIEREFDRLSKEIKRLKGILESKSKLDKLIIDELTEVRELLASPRRTKLIDAVQPNDDETEEKTTAEPAFVMFLHDNKLRSCLRNLQRRILSQRSSRYELLILQRTAFCACSRRMVHA